MLARDYARNTARALLAKLAGDVPPSEDEKPPPGPPALLGGGAPPPVKVVLVVKFDAVPGGGDAKTFSFKVNTGTKMAKLFAHLEKAGYGGVRGGVGWG